MAGAMGSIFRRGQSKGALDMLLELVDDRVISIQEAARRADMTETEFFALLREKQSAS